MCCMASLRFVRGKDVVGGALELHMNLTVPAR